MTYWMKAVKAVAFPVMMVVAATLIVAGCSGSDQTAGGGAAPQASSAPTIADGVYFAQEVEHGRTGWKNVVFFTVEGGSITDAHWTAAHTSAGVDKQTLDRQGGYGMKDNGGAQWHWWEQAEATAAHLVATQDPSTVEADAISGATINVSYFFELVQQALAAGPVGFGPWRDGHYSAVAEEYSRTGWMDTVDITVIGGRIIAVNWDAMAEDGGTNKKQRSMDGEYGMYGDGPATWPWWEQAEAAQAFLLDTQDPEAVETDAVTGASIRLGGFQNLVTVALAGASR